MFGLSRKSKGPSNLNEKPRSELSICIEETPKSAKTKEACKQAVLYVLDHPIIRDEIYQSKQLPLKLIQKNTNLPRKLLDHHRRYILAAIEILSGEYPMLAEYMSFIRKEGI